MDLITILTLITPILRPYIEKSMEELSSEAGKSLWELIKKPFTRKEELAVVTAIEMGSADQQTQAQLLLLLENQINTSPEYVQAIRQFAHNSSKQNIHVNQYGDKSVSINDNWGNININ